MFYKTSLFLTIMMVNLVSAGIDEIFSSGFEFVPIPISNINDTGIVWAGEYTQGFTTSCNSASITVPQDCNIGRDANLSTNTNDDGHAGFSFTKLDINGNSLPANAMNHSCVLDNVTGLVWEVKNETFDSIHNQNIFYKWGGVTAVGLNHPSNVGSYFDDWDILVNESNTENYCGFNNWRIPTLNELSDIANNGSINPAIETDYFPYTQSLGFWTSFPSAFNNNNAWIVSYDTGRCATYLRSELLSVRLVVNSTL